MMRMSCEAVRERLPEHLAGTAHGLTPMIEAHLEGCSECRADAALLEVLRRHPVLPPPGLQHKVLRALSAPPRKQRSFERRALLAAACLSAALLGGRALLRDIRSVPADVADVAPSVAARPAAVPAGNLPQPFPGSLDAPVTSGVSSLDDLSSEQLKSLIAELQS